MSGLRLNGDNGLRRGNGGQGGDKPETIVPGPIPIDPLLEADQSIVELPFSTTVKPLVFLNGVLLDDVEADLVDSRHIELILDYPIVGGERVTVWAKERLLEASVALANVSGLSSALASKVALADLGAANGNGGSLVILKRSEITAAALSLSERLGREIVPVIEWTGKTSKSDPAAYGAKIQGALNEGFNGIGGVMFTPEVHPFTELVWPNIENFAILGCGNSSVLKQYGGGLRFLTRATTCLNANGTIANIAFDGSMGTGHTIDTSYAQTMDINDVIMRETPDGFSSIFVNGNPADGTYSHDIRINRARFYHTNGYVAPGPDASPHPVAMIELGPLVADSEIIGGVAQGFYDLEYCILARPGAQATRIAHNHMYNTRRNIVRLEGGNGDFAFASNTWDYCKEDNVRIINGFRNSFVGDHFQFIEDGFSGLLLDNSYRCNVDASKFTALHSAAKSAVREINGSAQNQVRPGTIDDTSKYENPFMMAGADSYAVGFVGDTSAGIHSLWEGSSPVAVADGTSSPLGKNGITATSIGAAFATRSDGRVFMIKAMVNVAPTAGKAVNMKLWRGISPTNLIADVSLAGTTEAMIFIDPSIQRHVGTDRYWVEYIAEAGAGALFPSFIIEYGQ